MRALEAYFNDVWYGQTGGVWLRPLGLMYSGAMRLRRRAYEQGWREIYRAPCPVIVVGNFTAGGAGKTPLVIELCRRLQALGRKPGIISRGYGGATGADRAQLVRATSDAALVGDEPLLLARRTGAPVAVCPNRRKAVECVLAQDADLIVADDGLQHLQLARDANIAVIDGDRQFGNGRCLPAGPLRGPLDDTRPVDLEVINGGPATTQPQMNLIARHVRSLSSQAISPLADFAGKRVHAVAGIGHPARFFSTLRHVGIDVIEHPFADHAALRLSDVSFDDNLPVLMTEKDAVRFAAPLPEHCFDVPVDVEFNDAAQQAVDVLLARWQERLS